jgi:hypothetical protein
MLHLLFLTLVYFLPAIIGRDKNNATGIFLLNLFFGWTVIGWVIAFIWACSAQPDLRFRMIPVAVPGRYCCRCGSATCVGAHYCTACGYAI